MRKPGEFNLIFFNNNTTKFQILDYSFYVEQQEHILCL